MTVRNQKPGLVFQSHNARNARLKEKPCARFSKRALWTVLVVLILVGEGGCQTADEPAMQTAAVSQGDLLLYASGTGTLTAADQADLAFETGGRVTGIFVKAGDQVEAGDLLAQIDDTDAQIEYTLAKRNLLELTSPAAIASAQQGIAAAQRALDSAMYYLEYLISPDVLYWDTEIERAERIVKKATARTEASPSDEAAQMNLADAEAYLDFAKEKRADAHAYYEKVYVPETFPVISTEGENTHAVPTELELLEAHRAIAEAKVELRESKCLYAALTGKKVPRDATGSGLTELEQARLDLEAAQSTLDGARIYAPISGTIVSVDASVGNTVGTSAVITVAVLSQPYLEIFLDETDWDKIAVGKDAEVVFDALPDKVFTGQVTQVDPELYTSGNTSMVKGLVRLDSTFSELNLPLGSRATVDVIGEQVKNATLVPVEALHETAPGQYAVFVIEDGEPKPRTVEVGIQDLLHAEIKSGLEPGEIVATSITETE